jgi:hypothetical protein
MFRFSTAAALFSPSVGAQLEFVDDLSTGGFGWGGTVVGGLTLRVSDNVGIHSEVSGGLLRFRRIYRYWDAVAGPSETGVWRWGRLLSFSLGVRLAIR